MWSRPPRYTLCKEMQVGLTALPGGIACISDRRGIDSLSYTHEHTKHHLVIFFDVLEFWCWPAYLTLSIVPFKDEAL